MTALFEEFRHRLVARLEATALFPGEELHIDLILNPWAGAFRHRRRCQSLVEVLGPAVPTPAQEPRRVRVSTWTTEYPGHEKEILAHLQAADPLGPGARRLVVTAGGDGTSRGTLISALKLAPEARGAMVFFRLPLGTGNDAADVPTWTEALEVLSGTRSDYQIQNQPVIEIEAAGEPVHFSFNIASVGLDAFVCHLTNRLKDWFPGNSYSLMVDAAAFFYEAWVSVEPSRIVLSRQNTPVVDWSDRFLLAALGATGHRTYGSGKRVLPDDDNFCLAGKKNLFTKLKYRRPFYEGTHRRLADIVLARGDTLTVESAVRLPLQMDGEVLWLEPRAFPVTMTIRDHGLNVLSLARSPDGP